MSPKKLTEPTKQEILKLYRETDATTSTLAERYEVSSSTISRFLKASLSESEYEDLIQQKRLARTPKKEEDKPLFQQGAIEFVDIKAPAALTPFSPSFGEEEDEEETAEEPIDVTAISEMLGEDLVGIEDDLEDEEEDWEEDEEEDEEGSLEMAAIYGQPLAKVAQLQILPLSSANFPKICYLVIDRSAELITRPLKDFADLGKIPVEEIQQRTLPIFDSHRVARRFSKRRERVIKVPDGRMIQKTLSYLKSKGITRILLNGQLYSLSW